MNVLVTGGLGFIGSNLAIRLVSEGARVTVVDSSIKGCGANAYNLEPARDSIRLIEKDLAHSEDLREEIASADAIFNLAGEISHIHSMKYPERDLQINTVAQLRFLMECQEANPGVRVVYAGTRQIYGVPDYLPVDENHPIQPVDYNGVHKYAATMYHLMLARAGAIDAIVLRLTNVYGPRMALNRPCQGFLGTFVRTVITGRALSVFGDGLQLRDPMYVDDAVEAFLIAGLGPIPSRVYNIGGPEALSVIEIARLTSRAAGVDEPSLRPFPEEIRSIDIGSYCTDSSRAGRELGWKPQVPFSQGIQSTLDYYRRELPHYLSEPDPPCQIPEEERRARFLAFAAGR